MKVRDVATIVACIGMSAAFVTAAVLAAQRSHGIVAGSLNAAAIISMLWLVLSVESLEK